MTGSDFDPITTSGPLEAELRLRIEREGPITFRDFMEAALYHPRHGYYTNARGVTRRGGDFVTSPEVHPVFGALVGRTLLELWQAMGEPARFDVVEDGAGPGTLARDILAWAHRGEAAFATALTYSLVETSPAMREAQRATLPAASLGEGAVRTLDAVPPGIRGVVLSNELLDAFPVHRVTLEAGGLREVYVTCEHGRFHDVIGPLSTPDLARYFDDLGLLPGEGSFAEVNLAAADWMRGTAASLERGYVITLDYGYEAADLYAPWRRDGTLLCFSGQAASSDPYQRIGKQDMTSSVDFTTLKRVGAAAGLATLALTDQSSFLVRLGIGEGVAAAEGEMEEYFARRKVVMDLIDPGRLGRIKLLLQGKNVPAGVPRGFRD